MAGRRLFSALLVVALLLASCTSDGESSTEYCQSAANLASLESLLSPDSVRDPNQVKSAFETFADSLNELEGLAPSEISNDIGELGLAVDDVIVGLATVDFDLTQLDPDAAESLLDPFLRPAVQSSLERVDAFDTLNCNTVSPETDTAPTTPPTTAGETDPAEPAATVPAAPTADPVIALAAEYGDLIRTTFTDDEIDNMLAFADVTGVDELVNAIIAGDLTIEELDTFLQRTADGVPFAFGDDPDLDLLWNACAAEDWAACDGLYTSSPLNSLYQRFADTCARTLEEPTGGQCESTLG